MELIKFLSTRLWSCFCYVFGLLLSTEIIRKCPGYWWTIQAPRVLMQRIGKKTMRPLRIREQIKLLNAFLKMVMNFSGNWRVWPTWWPMQTIRGCNTNLMNLTSQGKYARCYEFIRLFQIDVNFNKPKHGNRQDKYSDRSIKRIFLVEQMLDELIMFEFRCDLIMNGWKPRDVSSRRIIRKWKYGWN